MPTSEPPREPATPLPVIPAATDERAMLSAFLDYHRVVVRRKAEGLTDAQMRTGLPGHPTTLTVGGILKHLAWVETKWAHAVFLGHPYGEIEQPWVTARGTDPDWEWDTSRDALATVLAWHDQATSSARHIYDQTADLATLSRGVGCADPGEPTPGDAEPYQLRWILTHLLEEYARHAGHLDLIREHLDGTTGN